MATSPSPVAEGARIGAAGRLAGALFNPRSTFEDIARRPSWLPPVTLYCALALAVTAIYTQRVGWERFMREQFERNPQFTLLSREQQQARVEQASKTAPILGAVAAVAFNILGPLAVAGLLMVAFRILSGADLNYKASLGLVAHAYMPLAVSGLLAIVVLLLKDPEAVDLENLVSANAAAFLAGDAPRWLRVLGTSMDLFSFWAIGLLATAFSAANPKKIRMGGALAIVIGLWLVFVLVKTGLTAALS